MRQILRLVLYDRHRGAKTEMKTGQIVAEREEQACGGRLYEEVRDCE